MSLFCLKECCTNAVKVSQSKGLLLFWHSKQDIFLMFSGGDFLCLGHLRLWACLCGTATLGCL